MDLPIQTGEPSPAHLRRRHRPLLVLVVAGAADPEEAAAELGPMTGLDESVDHRVNLFTLGRFSPNSLDAFFRIVTSSSSCRMRFFAFASSILSGVVIPGGSPRSIWSCRTQLWIAAALTPSSTAAVVIGLPARTSATALLRNPTGKGRGTGEASQEKPDPQTILGN